MFKTLSENLYGIQNIIAALIAGLIAWRYNSVAARLTRGQFSRGLIKDFEDRYIILRRKLIEIEDAERAQFMKEQLGEGLSSEEVIEESLFDPLSDTHPFVHTKHASKSRMITIVSPHRHEAHPFRAPLYCSVARYLIELRPSRRQSAC